MGSQNAKLSLMYIVEALYVAGSMDRGFCWLAQYLIIFFAPKRALRISSKTYFGNSRRLSSWLRHSSPSNLLKHEFSEDLN